MKFRKNWKRFWTLDRHHAEGFTLVELIVVIAILAILAGVGTVGYSGYVKKANMQADITLASEIEQALILAYYDGTLQPGATVIVYYDDKDVKVDGVESESSAHDAMVAAFGESYTSLRLKWDGWADELGVAADATMMGYVDGSNFNSNNMGEILDQVQVVVNAAAGYFEGTGSVDADSPLADYLDNAGISYKDGINSDNSNAVANALVFVVADNLSKVDTTDTATVDKFWAAWRNNNFVGNTDLNWDVATANAASYAMVYGAATYVDSITKTTNYRAQMEGGPEDIRNNRDTVLAAIKANNSTEYIAYRAGGTSSLMYKDAMAFLAYMQGVSTSADSLTKSTNLYSDSYFNDGTVLNYVNDYIAISNALTAADAENGAFIFYFNGETVACMPLDY